MRILTVANHLGARGGLERTQLTTCKALAARGHQIDLVYVSRGDFAEDWEEFTETTVQISGSLPRRRSPLTSGAGLLRAIRAALRLRPEVVYVYRYWDLPYAVTVATMLRVPVVFYLCLPPPRRVPRWLGMSLMRVDRTIAVSQDAASRWAGSGLREKRTAVVLTGIDLQHYVPASPDARLATRRELGLEPTAFVVLYAGRIGREKGVDLLVKACRRLVTRVPELHLVVVGGPSLGAEREDSEHYASELRRLADRLCVSWLSARRDVLPLIQTADVSVLPSIWPEPLSRAAMESLACGVPVVASRVGGNPEIMSGWLSDFLVPPGDVEALAQRLQALNGWRRREPRLGSRCRDAVMDRLSLDRESDRVETILLEATSSRGRSASHAGASSGAGGVQGRER